MNIRQLQYFVQTSKTCNFSQTAAECFTSRQNVRQTIRSLELEFGEKLFEINGNRLVLTPFGEEFAERAKETVRSFESLRDDFTLRSRGKERAVVFAVDISYASNGASFFDALQRYAQSRNGCEIFTLENTSDECYSMVLHKESDICLLMSMKREFPECEAIKLLEYPIGLLVDGKNILAKKRCIEVCDLEGQRLLAPIGFAFQYYRLIHECSLVGFTLAPAYVINDGREAVNAVRRNYGVMLTDSREDETASSQGLRVVPFEDKEMTFDIYLVWRKDSDRKKRINDFVSFLLNDISWRKHCSSTGYDRWEKH